MRAALRRAVPGSRALLRGLMWSTAFVGLQFLPASFRSAQRLDAEQHNFVAGWVALTPWIAIAAATVFGTAAQFEDAVFRRRFLSSLVLGLAFPAIGWLVHVCCPDVRWPVTGFSAIWIIYWIADWYGWLPLNGAGPWVDRWIARWFGPANAAETAMRTRERQIRDAATQEERHRLAQDLHDSIKQEIFAIHTSAATAEARLASDPDGVKAALEQIRVSSRDAMTEMEALLDRLHAAPLENTGLVRSLRKQCEALALRTGADVTCTIGTLPDSSQLPPDAHDALFRIAQEALSNIGRHARATRVRVTLRLVERALQLLIEDDGQGFNRRDGDAATRGMGLANMRARAEAVGGRFECTAAPGRGVTIRVGIIVLSKLQFGFGDLPRWLVWTLGAIVVVPALAALSILGLRSGWYFWAELAPLIGIKILVDHRRRHQLRQRIG